MNIGEEEEVIEVPIPVHPDLVPPVPAPTPIPEPVPA